ncbi:EAL domain-containing protein [Ectothiorhodospiraceae bacterium WFHF3C12]|nr:EAL domain-containing protein [Ectothiorhodospiraceae bacterium WFHF3C12]
MDGKTMSPARNDMDGPWRVENALINDANQSLLFDALASKEITVDTFGPETDDGAQADLLIVDQQSLARLRGRIEQLRNETLPVVLPVLLLGLRDQLSTRETARVLGTTAEDIVRLPTSAPELRARVENLLRLRELSKRQFQTHRHTSQALAGVSRALRTLNACNEVMLRQTSEEGLLSSVCRVITESEGYALAWVGFANELEPTDAVIDKRAVAGPAAGFATSVHVRWDETSHGTGPSGRAVATGQTQIVTDLMEDPRAAPWHEELKAWGLAAVISLPLRPTNGAPGVLSVYSSQSGDFAADERQLLERLAQNLNYGIDSLRLRNERERQQREIRELAFSDSLTQLPNRRYLLRHLDSVVAAESETHAAGVLFIDLDDFKLVNDALGHAAGDRLLRWTAQRIQSAVRAGDLVARQGGDEFIVVMVDNPRDGGGREANSVERLESAAQALAERIADALRRPYEIEGYRHHLGASIGVSLLPHYGDNAEQVIDQADMAMYEAKKVSRCVAFYESGMAARRTRRLSLEARMHRALEAEEFQLHYQPIWRTEDSRIVGVEALIRWQDEDGMSVSPGEFIPVAEEIGLIGPISDWVMSTAARQLAAWRQQGVELTMAVNLSATQMRGEQSAAHIRDMATGSGTEPDWWSLELTEEMIMHEPVAVAKAMRDLADSGFRLALDDFGSGYSSLARLQSLPLDTLKIDKQFVSQLSSGGRGDPIVKAIVDITEHLSMTALAEGIETDEQRAQLASLGCTLGQGFLLSAAIPGDRIPELLMGGIGKLPGGVTKSVDAFRSA